MITGTNTSPLTDTVAPPKPVADSVTSPVVGPVAAVDASRTWIVPVVVAAGTERLPENVVPPSDTSQPVGAVTVIADVRVPVENVNVFAAETAPFVDEKSASDAVLTVIRANAVPLTETEALAAPALDNVTEPDAEPTDAVAAKRTEIVPVVVAVGTETLPEKLAPSNDTCHPVGAVTVMAPVRFTVVKVNVAGTDADPFVVTIPVRLAGVTEIDGASTSPLTDTVRSVAPGLSRKIVCDTPPTGAVDGNRTYTIPEVVPIGTGVVAKKFVPSRESSRVPLGIGYTLIESRRSVVVKLNVCVAEASPLVVTSPDNDVGVTVMVGTRTVPLTATFWVTAPALVHVTLPEGLPDADAVRRTDMISGSAVVAKFWLAANDVPFNDTSKPLGAVTVAVPARFDPLSVNVAACDATPFVEANGPSVAGLA